MNYKILFATKNKGKIKEINEIMKDTGMVVVSMEEAGIHKDVIEDGTTFEENALKKAVQIMELSGQIVLADDSGLEVDYLNKAPGIYSARFGGKETTDEEKNQKILNMLEGVPEEKRTGRFVCVIAAAFPDGRTEIVRATIEGRIAYESKGTFGFGYDPIFFIPEYNMTTAEMEPWLKNQISHRGKALQKMKGHLVHILKEN